jgi:hypothetical protein
MPEFGSGPEEKPRPHRRRRESTDAGCTKIGQGAVERLHSIDFRADRNACFRIDDFFRRSKRIFVL